MIGDPAKAYSGRRQTESGKHGVDDMIYYDQNMNT